MPLRRPSNRLNIPLNCCFAAGMPISRAFRHCTLKKPRKIATFLRFSSLLRRFTCLIMSSTPLRDEQSNIFAKQCFEGRIGETTYG